MREKKLNTIILLYIISLPISFDNFPSLCKFSIFFVIGSYCQIMIVGLRISTKWVHIELNDELELLNIPLM